MPRKLGPRSPMAARSCPYPFGPNAKTTPMVGPSNGEWDFGVTRFKEGQIVDEVTHDDAISWVRIFNIKSNSFSCVFETSKDHGKTWMNPINVEAVRANE